MADAVSSTIDASARLITELRRTVAEWRLISDADRRVRERKVLRTKWTRQLGQLKAVLVKASRRGPDAYELAHARHRDVMDALEEALAELREVA
jgi:hypothetical protein